MVSAETASASMLMVIVPMKPSVSQSSETATVSNIKPRFPDFSGSIQQIRQQR